jgi:hypothetical protein
MSAWDGVDRRKGPRDRRVAVEDRRNAERVSDDKFPRRNPEVADRRSVAREERREPERVTDEAYLRRAQARSQRRAASS